MDDLTPKYVFGQLAEHHLGDGAFWRELAAIAQLASQAFSGDRTSHPTASRSADIRSAASHAKGLRKAVERLDPRNQLMLLGSTNNWPVEPSGSAAGNTSARLIATTEFMIALEAVERTFIDAAQKPSTLPRGAPPTPKTLGWMLALLANVWIKAGPARTISTSGKKGSFGAFVDAFCEQTGLRRLFPPAQRRTALRAFVAEHHKTSWAQNIPSATKPADAIIKPLIGSAPSPEDIGQAQAAVVTGRAKLPLPLVARIPLCPWLTKDDFRTAVQLARLPTLATATARANAVAANVLTHRVLRVQALPQTSDIRAVAAALLAIESRCGAILGLVLERMPNTSPEPDLLSVIRDPLILALADAAGDLEKTSVGCDRLRRILDGIRALETFAREARTQFEAAARAAERSDAVAGPKSAKRRTQDAARLAVRELALDLIRSYVQLTGRRPAYSRGSPSADSPNKPDGPLIRFLEHLFQTIRSRFDVHPDLDGVSKQRYWHPARETLAKWIREYRAASSDQTSA